MWNTLIGWVFPIRQEQKKAPLCFLSEISRAERCDLGDVLESWKTPILHGERRGGGCYKRMRGIDFCNPKGVTGVSPLACLTSIRGFWGTGESQEINHWKADMSAGSKTTPRSWAKNSIHYLVYNTSMYWGYKSRKCKAFSSGICWSKTVFSSANKV